jgi:hypothetical protein
MSKIRFQVKERRRLAAQVWKENWPRILRLWLRCGLVDRPFQHIGTGQLHGMPCDVYFKAGKHLPDMTRLAQGGMSMVAYTANQVSWTKTVMKSTGEVKEVLTGFLGPPPKTHLEAILKPRFKTPIH